MKKEMLKKMQMPKKPMAEDEAEMDLGLELGNEEDMPMEEDAMAEDMPMDNGLTEMSDDELVMELKNRGLALADIKKLLEGDEEVEETAEEEMEY